MIIYLILDISIKEQNKQKMTKPNKSKKMGFIGKSVIVAGIIGASIVGLSYAGAFDKAVTTPVQSVTQTSIDKVPVTITTFDKATDIVVADQTLLVTSSGNVKFEVTSGITNSENFIFGQTYKVQPLDYGTFGSDAVIGDGIVGAKIVGDAFEFTVPSTGFNLDLGISKLGTYSILAEDKENGNELFVGASNGYVTADTIVFDSDANGTAIPLDEMISIELMFKPVTKDVEVNDMGTFYVIDASADVYEDLSLKFNTLGLKELTKTELEDGYAKVTYDALKNKRVFLLDESNTMVRNNEYSLTLGGNKIEGTVATDMGLQAYAIGTIKTTKGAELSVFKADGITKLHDIGFKDITFNFA